MITVGGKVVADMCNALAVCEAAYPVVMYIPRANIDMSLLTRSDHQSYCPYKGDASYYSLPAGGGPFVDALWTHGDPSDVVVAIKSHVAFYPGDRLLG